MKVYIAGPITGRPDGNRPAFAAAAAALADAGWIPVNPHNLHDGEPDLSYGAYLRRDIAHLVTCAALYALPGWETSHGARLEVQIARACDIPVFRARDGFPPPSPDTALHGQAADVGSRP